MKFTKLLFAFMVYAAAINTIALAATHVLMDTGNQFSHAIFPSNQFTAIDSKTGAFHVDLPEPESNCTDPSMAVCTARDLLNTMDGFSVNPRIMVCFSGAVDPNIAAANIFIVEASQPAGNAIALNQAVYDDKNYCLFAKPNQVLRQATTYLLLVRRSAVGNDDRSALNATTRGTSSYAQALKAALDRVPANGNPVVGASLFTTLGATSWLQGAYKFVQERLPPVIMPAGMPFNFSLNQIQSFTYRPAQSASQPTTYKSEGLLDGVGQVGFGLFLSPNYLNTSGAQAGTITTSPNQPVSVLPLLGPFVPVSFHVFLPSTPPPSIAGYPVIIYGHGSGDTQFGAATYIASTFAKQGLATLAFEITGHGYGQGSSVTVTDKSGATHTVATPGRGVLLPGSSTIGSMDGCVIPGAIALRDCERQTAVDLFALVKTLKTYGIALGLDSNSIYFVGQSLGAFYGSLAHAVDPGLKAAVLNAGGGPSVDDARLAVSGRPLAQLYVCSQGLANVPSGKALVPQCASPAAFQPGVSAQPEQPFGDIFNDNYPFRDHPALVNNIDGALQLQAVFEAAEWVGMLGDPLAFAPHFKTEPLPGVPPKPVLFQASVGDLEVPNPLNNALIRAAGGEASSIIFDFPRAAAADSSIAAIFDPAAGAFFPITPHRILSNPTIFDYPSEYSVAMAEQQTVARFFLSGGKTIPDSNEYLMGSYSGLQLFHKGLQFLPPELNFLPMPQPMN